MLRLFCLYLIKILYNRKETLNTKVGKAIETKKRIEELVEENVDETRRET